MKKFAILLTMILISELNTLAATSTVKTFTPINPYHNYNFNHNHHYRHLPPNYQNRRYYDNYDNYYYNNYPYYYPQKQSILTKLGNFFSRGNMTGYTPSYNSSFDNIPYGYQEGFQDSNGNYYYDNYNQQSNSTIKFLD